MKLRQIFHKLIGKVLFHIFRLFGKDQITLIKIKTRDDLQEIGTKYGGWVIPVNLLNENSICYCVGCGEDISFDLGLIGSSTVSVEAGQDRGSFAEIINFVTI